MSRSRDWMPTTIQGKIDMGRNWVNILEAKHEAWGIPEGVYENLARIVEDVEDAHSRVVPGDATPSLRQRRNRLLAKMETAMRGVKRRHFFIPPLLPEDFLTLGLQLNDGTLTPQEAPTTIPEIEVNTAVIRQLGFRMRGWGAARWGKPDGVHAMELSYHLGSNPPAEVDAYIHKRNATSSPIIITFAEAERGLRVHYAARWMNDTEQPGPWSEIGVAVIP